ncbi:MAG: bifunctional folylpolyglutamate synthase/dihydrofolate synthase [Oscillospiraceae bacterium]|nr:bifunctional folylpolyglutamate synthase/dihydrofolate synthase [Oscillospiraceae bacterium]
MAGISELELRLRSKKFQGIRLGLSRVRELAERLGNPQENFKIIHIAGTNGKGSFGAMLAGILAKAGYQTGHFASPALLDIRDYFRMNQKLPDRQTLREVLGHVLEQAEQMQDTPTEFEILAVTAYLLFSRQKCDFAVIECCMGGDLDCTNIIQNPVLSVITNIQKDHCRFLGDTLPEIARHKAGIIKPGCLVLTGEKNPEILKIIQAQSKCLQADYYPAENLVISANYYLTGTELNCRGFGKLKLSLLGAYQAENANLVLNAVRILRKSGILIPDQAVRDGFACCCWHGRFEVISAKNPCVIFDGAHNPDGIEMLTKSLDLYFQKKSIFILGILADKEYSLYGKMLKDYAEEILLVRPDHVRALDPECLKTALQRDMPGIPLRVCDSMENALRTAREILPADSQMICLGSLYLYREFLNTVKHQNLQEE